MRKFSQALLLILLASYVLPIFSIVYAADFETTMIRLTRIAPSASSGGLVCVTTPNTDNGIENRVQIIFPSGFTLNSNTSNWTVTTSNLPAGALAWPGIGTANSVSGQTVTFPSSDLSENTQYCFNFAPSGTLTNPSSTGSYSGTVRTRNASNVTVDSKLVGFGISNDQITVTATVPAQPSDFEATLIKSDPPRNTFGQNETIIYRLSYGSHLNSPSTITVEAEWELGTIQGNVTPTEDILDYVIGTATNGYNNSPPVIDTVNRKITWTISPFPANLTGQIVEFQLKTNNSYTTPVPVTFDVNGRVLGPGTQTSDSTVSLTYFNTSQTTPTPAPTCAVNCPTSTPGPTATPTPQPQDGGITGIEIRSISATQAAIFVSTRDDSTVTVNYGTDLNALNLSSSSNIPSKSHLLVLTDLDPKSRYYFRIRIRTANGESVVSDFHLLDTASGEKPPEFLAESLIVTSSDVILTDPLRVGGLIPVIILPVNTSYAFKFSLKGYDNVKQIRGIVRYESVLGASTDKPQEEIQALNVTEVAPGQYIGRISTPTAFGNYNLVLQIHDFAGNLTEQVIGSFKIVGPLTVIDRTTKTAIEKARILYYFYNSRLKTYELLDSNLSPIKNPSYTNPDGTVPGVLPEGRYKVEIQALGYKSKTVEFEVKEGGTNYPMIELESLPFSAGTYVQYTLSAAGDMANLLRDYIQTLRSSNRYFDFLAFTVIFSFAFLGVLATANRLNIPLQYIPFYLSYSVLRLFRNRHAHILRGQLQTPGGSVVNGAQIYATVGNKVISHTKSTINGEFLLKLPDVEKVRLTIKKNGFENLVKGLKRQEFDENIELSIKDAGKPAAFSFQSFLWYYNYVSSSLFEALLVVTILLEFLFVLEFGWLKVLPFFAISVLNIVLFTVHTRHARTA